MRAARAGESSILRRLRGVFGVAELAVRQSPVYLDGPGFEVHIRPPESEYLPRPHPGADGDGVECAAPLIRRVQQRPDLIGVQGLYLVPLQLRRPDGFCGVSRYEAVHHGLCKRALQQGVGVLHRAGGLARVEHAPVEPADVVGPELGELHAPHTRHQMTIATTRP